MADYIRPKVKSVLLSPQNAQARQQVKISIEVEDAPIVFSCPAYMANKKLYAGRRIGVM